MDYGQPLFLHPDLVSLGEYGLDRHAIRTRHQRLVIQPMRQILCRVDVGMRRVLADLTTERLLFGAVLASDMVTAMAFLRAVGARDCPSAEASFGGSPGDWLGEVGQIGGLELGVHAPHLEAHSSAIHMLIGDLGVGVIARPLVDGASDLLAHSAGQLPILG
jgi:hypothetical protein